MSLLSLIKKSKGPSREIYRILGVFFKRCTWAISRDVWVHTYIHTESFILYIEVELEISHFTPFIECNTRLDHFFLKIFTTV